MMRNLIILAILIAAIAGYTWYDDDSRQRVSAAQQISSATLDQPAADFTFETLDGESHRLSDLKGKVIVLNFWASWCAPCVIEFPQMIALADATRNNSVFVFVSQDDTIEDIRIFLKKHIPQAPDNVLIARDSNKHIAQTLYQTYKLPETYIIDPAFSIRKKIIGNSVDWAGKDMQSEINAMANSP